MVPSVLLVFAMLSSTLVAQEPAQEEAQAKKPTAEIPAEHKLTGFDFLEQFEGAWSTTAKGDDGEASGGSLVHCKPVGRMWMVMEHSGMMGGTKFSAIQTLGYDAEKKRFFGSWVDSMMSFTWQYEGVLDESGKKIILNATGPDMTDPKKVRDYRDAYEFVSDNEVTATSQIKNDAGEWETMMQATMKRVNKDNKKPMAATKKSATEQSVTPFLMFTGKAEEAMEFYKTVFEDAKILSMNKYGPGETGKEGSVQLATFSIEGQLVKCIDSPPVHDFDFTPSFSFFVECDSEEELKKRFEQLSKDGKVMMPLNNYGFSKQFGWTSDRFGVSWQLNLKE